MPLGKDRYCLPSFILVAVDAVVFFSAILLAYHVRFDSVVAAWFPPEDPAPAYPMYVRLSLATTLIGLFVFQRFGFYRYRDGLVRHSRPIILMVGVWVAYIFVLCLLFYYRAFSYSRLTVVFAVAGCSGAVLLAQPCLRAAQDWMVRHGIGFRKTLVVVDEANCVNLVNRLRSNHGSRYQVVGAVSVNGFVGKQMAGLPVLGRINRLGRVLKRNPVDCVLVASNRESVAQVQDVAETCTSFGVECCFVPDVYEQLSRHLEVGVADPLPILTVGETPLSGGQELVKTTLDVVLASVALSLLAAPMLVIALIVKLESRGPVFYRQPRLSSQGRVFSIYKFRSMRQNAEHGILPVWASRDDPRCTRVGRLIRKLNLDELPQLFNVMRGEMSLVGPRPERPFFINQFKHDIPQYMRRYMVKPGITGWAQVNGLRGDTSVEQRTRYDLYYVENWSLLLDLKILLRTPFAFTNAH